MPAGDASPPPRDTRGRAVELAGITKRYGRRVALNDLNLSVARGALLGLVGSNGAGKTTTLLLTAGLLRADVGRIDVLGAGPFNPGTMAGRVGLMPQDSALPPDATPRDLLGFYAALQGLSPPAAREESDRLLASVHLTDRAQSRMRTLSHGMRRRVMIAQAFLGDPELVLLDEPMSGLDPREVFGLRQWFMAQRGSRTILLSSHQLGELEKLCDAIAFIEQGRVVRQDTLAAVTGHDAVLRYDLARRVDLGALTAAVPEARFEWESSDAPVAALLCHYPGGLELTAVNARVLPLLLAAGAGVLEVRRGAELEAVYMRGHGPVP